MDNLVSVSRSAHDYSLAASDGGQWKPGFPRGKYYEGMEHDYEVAFTPLMKWHRKRTPEARAASVEFSGWRDALSILFPRTV